MLKQPGDPGAPTHAWVAYLTCGHAFEMLVDMPGMRRELRSFNDANKGREIKRVTLDEARATPIYVVDCITCRLAMGED